MRERRRYTLEGMIFRARIFAIIQWAWVGIAAVLVLFALAYTLLWAARAMA